MRRNNLGQTTRGVATLALVVVLCGLSACSNPSDTAIESTPVTATAPAPTPEPTAPTEPTEPTAPTAPTATIDGDELGRPAGHDLVVWVNPDPIEPLTSVADRFSTDNGLSIVVQRAEPGELSDRFMELGPQGQGPDVLMVALVDLVDLVATESIAPLDTDTLVDSATPANRPDLVVGDLLYAVPAGADGFGLVVSAVAASPLLARQFLRSAAASTNPTAVAVTE